MAHHSNFPHELLDEAKHASIAMLAVAILFGMGLGIALFLHYV
jgi:hypothetical protein